MSRTILRSSIHAASAAIEAPTPPTDKRPSPGLQFDATRLPPQFPGPRYPGSSRTRKSGAAPAQSRIVTLRILPYDHKRILQTYVQAARREPAMTQHNSKAHCSDWVYGNRPWQRLYLRPDSQGHRSLRPTFGSVLEACTGRFAASFMRRSRVSSYPPKRW